MTLLWKITPTHQKSFYTRYHISKADNMPNLDENQLSRAAQRKSKARKWGALGGASSVSAGGNELSAKGLAYEKDFIGNITSFRLTPAVTKTLKFRAVTLLTTLGITWVVTGSPIASLSVTAIQQSTNTMVYYFFEQNEKSKREGKGSKQKDFSASS
jgi:uncharacterized membrane protein